MATTSMHKPGWRSRRRSRLSLVERAVPRLGHVTPPEDKPKSTHPGAAKAPISSAKPLQHQPRGDRATKGQHGVADPQAAGKSKPDADLQTVAGIPAATGTQEVTGTKTSVLPEATAKSGIPEAENAVSSDRLSSDNALSPPMVQADPSPTSSLPKTASTAKATSMEIAPQRQTRGHVAKPQDAPPPPSTAGASETHASGTNVDLLKEEIARLSDEMERRSTGPVLTLEWDRLVACGFTDPRDRSQPLAKNMDEIVRALIRQALSDQSSWRDRVILVTSPTERASKTIAAINFAFGLTTIANHRVVLVDVDATGAGAVHRLGGGERPGIAAALSDDDIVLHNLAIRTDLDRLTLVASGAADDETLDHFASRRMLQILRHLTEDPDTILIIDAPPILASQEAAVLSVIAGQVVLAVEAGRTTAEQIELALQRIGDRHNVSLVLNESSGRAGNKEVRHADQQMALAGRRKRPSAKRRLSRAVAIVGTVIAGLIAPQPGAHAGLNDGLPAQQAVMPAGDVLLPERLPIDLETPKIGCPWACW